MEDNKMYVKKGLHTALVTPFKNDQLDEEGLRHLLSLQKEVDGIVILGTTGESPTLTLEEKMRILKISREGFSGSLMAGVGSPSTLVTITLAKMAADFGANSLLVVAPFYNKPTQEGIFLHFKAIAQATPLPIIVYSIPGRCAVNVEVSTMKRLLEIDSIVGIKEASGNLSQIEHMISLKKIRPDFLVFSGDDALTFPLMTLGGDGVISTTSNLYPSLMKQLVNHLLNNEIVEGRRLHFELLPLFRNLFIETNPIPLKAALNHLGLPSGTLRLPLTPLGEHHEKELFQLLKKWQ